jgi:hypothetical protein
MLFVRVFGGRRVKTVTVMGHGPDAFYQLWHLLDAVAGFPSRSAA